MCSNQKLVNFKFVDLLKLCILVISELTFGHFKPKVLFISSTRRLNRFLTPLELLKCMPKKQKHIQFNSLFIVARLFGSVQ